MKESVGSPEWLDYWAQFAVGSAGRFIERSWDLIQKDRYDVPFEPNEIPLVRKVWGRAPSYAEFNSFTLFKLCCHINIV